MKKYLPESKAHEKRMITDLYRTLCRNRLQLQGIIGGAEAALAGLERDLNDPEMFMFKSIGDLGLTNLTEMSLSSRGVECVGDLIVNTEQDLGLGEAVAKEEISSINQVLGAEGLRLGMSESDILEWRAKRWKKLSK
ncbi:MAG: hypothetical protein V1928_00755 [Parcubacteria group bacterium]